LNIDLFAIFAAINRGNETIGNDFEIKPMDHVKHQRKKISEVVFVARLKADVQKNLQGFLLIKVREHRAVQLFAPRYYYFLLTGKAG